MGVRLKGGLPADIDNGLSHVAEVLDTDTTQDIWVIGRLHCDSSERHNDTGTFTHKLRIGAIEALPPDSSLLDRVQDLMSDARLKRTGEAMLNFGDGPSGSSAGDPAETARQAEAARFSDDGDAPITPAPQPGVVAGDPDVEEEDVIEPVAPDMTEPTPLTGRRGRGRRTSG